MNNQSREEQEFIRRASTDPQFRNRYWQVVEEDNVKGFERRYSFSTRLQMWFCFGVWLSGMAWAFFAWTVSLGLSATIAEGLYGMIFTLCGVRALYFALSKGK